MKGGWNGNYAWGNFDYSVFLSCWKQHSVNINKSKLASQLCAQNLKLKDDATAMATATKEACIRWLHENYCKRSLYLVITWKSLFDYLMRREWHFWWERMLIYWWDFSCRGNEWLSVWKKWVQSTTGRSKKATLKKGEILVRRVIQGVRFWDYTTKNACCRHIFW